MPPVSSIWKSPKCISKTLRQVTEPEKEKSLAWPKELGSKEGMALGQVTQQMVDKSQILRLPGKDLLDFG